MSRFFWKKQTDIIIRTEKILEDPRPEEAKDLITDIVGR
jgi:hypothetical protein